MTMFWRYARVLHDIFVCVGLSGSVNEAKRHFGSVRMMDIRTKRVYDAPQPDDGFRALVDRLWPRGLKKDQLEADIWLKEAAPSNELRKAFRHEPSKWEEFRKRYFDELDQKQKTLDILFEKAKEGPVTLLYAARDRDRNQAVVLKEYLEAKGK